MADDDGRMKVIINERLLMMSDELFAGLLLINFCFCMHHDADQGKGWS